MGFKRWLTSVLCSCILLSSILVVPASAADDDNYYSLSPVSASEPSLSIEWPVNPVAGEYNSILGSIARQLGDISSQIEGVQKNQVTIAQLLSGISGIITNNGKSLARIETFLSSSESILTSISDKVATETTLSAISNKVATESTLSAFWNTWKYYFDGNHWAVGIKPDGSLVTTNFATVFNNAMRNLSYDTPIGSSSLTLRGMVHQLQQVLASDDDKKLAESQKENREQIEKDFVNGSSGKTSLGKDDFGSLSSVGGTFKDITSLNGQSSISDFTSGLTDADTTGQGWFSQSTKDALDSVTDSSSSTSTVSTFSDDGLSSVDVDPDPYNMGNFEDNYSWLWGEK